MTWQIHRKCRACDRMFTFPGPPINRTVCDECMVPNKLGIQRGKCEGADIEALEYTIHTVPIAASEEFVRQCRGWAESDLEHAAHQDEERQ